MTEISGKPASTPPPRLVVFFDGGCGLCGREIAHYRRLDKAGRIHWVDITRDTDILAGHGLEPAAAMAVFHVKDARGTLHRGVGGFLEMWRHLPYYRGLAWLVRRLRLEPLLSRAYRVFARWRLTRRGEACALENGGGR